MGGGWIRSGTMKIIDCHTHDTSRQNAIISVAPGYSFVSGKIYSVGIHPWSVSDDDEEIMSRLVADVRHPSVVAIGEVGIDKLRGCDLRLQKNRLEQQLDIARDAGKPVIFHVVKAFQELVELNKRMHPSEPWIIHGFRGKPQLAKELLKFGFYLSFGEHFNSDTVAMMSVDRVLVETDESFLTIEEIASKLPRLDMALPYHLFRLSVADTSFCP